MIGFYHEDEEYGCFSNWFISPFTYAGIRYASSEQFMMYHKVQLFGKGGLAKQILSTSDPAMAKKLARQPFPEFDHDLWEKVCYNIVKRGVSAKFRQNRAIQDILINTGNEVIAECSPTDRKWGIGIGIDDPKRLDAGKWKGRNLLGRILMEVREELVQERIAAAAGFESNYDVWGDENIPEWDMTAGELKRNPHFYNAIHTYSDTLNGTREREAFYNGKLRAWDHSMQWNMGGGLPIIGFYEMKQEIYDIAARQSNLKLALRVNEKAEGKKDTANEQEKPLASCHRIHIFALTWLLLLKKGLSEDEFKQCLLGEGLAELGFTMDCGHSFAKKYPDSDGFTNNREFKKIIQNIDIKTLGDAIFSKWRYWNHWSDYEDMKEEDFQWFVIALKKLAELTKETQSL